MENKMVATICFKADLFATSEIAFSLYGEVIKEGLVAVTRVDRAAITVACQMQGVKTFEIDWDNTFLKQLYESRQERLEAQYQQYCRACDKLLELVSIDREKRDYYLERYEVFSKKAYETHKLVLANMRATYKALYGVTTE